VRLCLDEHYAPRIADALRKRSIGLFVEALDRLLRDHPAEDAIHGQARWLLPPPRAPSP
jgi:hypothetical protein